VGSQTGGLPPNASAAHPRGEGEGGGTSHGGGEGVEWGRGRARRSPGATAGPVGASQRRRERRGGRTGRVMKPPGAPAKATGGSGTPEWCPYKRGGGPPCGRGGVPIARWRPIVRGAATAGTAMCQVAVREPGRDVRGCRVHVQGGGGRGRRPWTICVRRRAMVPGRRPPVRRPPPPPPPCPPQWGPRVYCLRPRKPPARGPYP
jgi:hypothetical protein